MGQADFQYGSGDAIVMPGRDAANDCSKDRAGIPLAVSIFADRIHVRDTMRDDAQAVGFRLEAIGNIADLLNGDAHSLGEVVLLDCPVIEGANLEPLTLLDIRAARSGVQLVISTSVGALDDVFGCLDQSNP